MKIRLPLSNKTYYSFIVFGATTVSTTTFSFTTLQNDNIQHNTTLTKSSIRTLSIAQKYIEKSVNI